MVERRIFGTHEGREVPLLTITDGPWAVELIPYGASVRSLRVPDRTRACVDVCLGYDTLEEYETSNGCLGAVVGRYANRISGARFTLNGQDYHLYANEGENTLHGGLRGFHKQFWAVKEAEGDHVTFALDSPDGEEGFPGTLHVEVTYTLRDGALSITYRAESDRDTVVNLTNHSYFNLGGQGSGRIDSHKLLLRAERYTPAGPGNIPTGALDPVAGTSLDLRAGAVMGERLAVLPGGFDHNFALDGGEAPAAVLYCPDTGIVMEVETDLEGVQLYSSGGLSRRRGKDGAEYGPFHALCLETQHFPDAVNRPEFPSPILRAGEQLESTTTYRFLTC